MIRKPVVAWLSVDFLAMTDAYYKDQQPVVLNLADQTIAADTVAPELCELAMQRLARLARVFKALYRPKILQNSMGRTPVEFAKLLARLRGQFNSPDQRKPGQA